jgi:hypothetical protein
VWSIPTVLLVIAITFALGKGFWQIFIAVGLTMWVDIARVVRGEVLSIKEKEYVEATRALGYSTFRTIFHHILPNIVGAIVVVAASNFASAILLGRPQLPRHRCAASHAVVGYDGQRELWLYTARQCLPCPVARFGHNGDSFGLYDACQWLARCTRHQA